MWVFRYSGVGEIRECATVCSLLSLEADRGLKIDRSTIADDQDAGGKSWFSDVEVRS